MKSSLVVAGLGDLMRPAHKLSLNQSISLTATGLIWTRVSFYYIFYNNFFSILCFLVLYGYYTEKLFSWSCQFFSWFNRSSTINTYCALSLYTS
jgi:hypothetical protein